MVEIFSKQEAVIMHYKDGEPVAMTHSNGHQTLYKLDGEMKHKDLEDFYETQKPGDVAANKAATSGSGLGEQ